MKDTKPFWASWTLWGAVATFLGVILPNFGLNVEPGNITTFFQSFQAALDAVLTFGGLALTVFGRITAKDELTLRRKS